MDFCFTQAESLLREISCLISRKIALLVMLDGDRGRDRAGSWRVMAVMIVIVRVVVVVVMPDQVDIEFHAGDGGFLLARNVEVIAVELQLFQLAFQLARVHAQVNQRGDEHVAG